jgi:PAS domain S-box-containing protein
LTDITDERVLVRALKGGATDFVLKDRRARLAPMVKKALTDLTDRRTRLQAEEAARHSSELLRASISASPLATVLLDPQGVVTMWNSAAEQIFGWRESEVLGRLLPSVADDMSAEFAALRFRVLGGETLTGVELRRTHKQGHQLDISLSTAPVYDAGGAVVAIMALMSDISERKRIDRELQQSESRFRAAFEESAIGMCLTDLAGGLLMVNPYFCNMLGYSREDLCALDLYQITFPDDVEKSRRWTEGLLAGEDFPARMEKRFVTRSGDLVWGEVSKNLVHAAEGTPLYFVSQIQDMTERKSLEKHLEQAQKIESIGQLAGGVAHDFNNMLSVILGHVELALRKSENDRSIAGDLKAIRKAAVHSADLTRQLLTFARKQIISPQILDLNEAVAGMLKMLQRLIGENIELTWQPGGDLWPVKADSAQMDQILANLCVNSRDAISGRGKISIKTTNASIDEHFSRSRPYALQPGDYVRLSVSDDGCGMKSEVQSHIFEPFYTTKEVGSGTGLGLATVYGAVKQNHGFITFYSEVGEGTIFNIFLPAMPAARARAAEVTVELLRCGSETLLLVEDDQMLLELETAMLEAVGYRVLAASCGEEALSLARSHQGPIPLLISDLIMPQINGRELAEKVQLYRPQVKVLFMSGYDAEIISSQGILAEGVHFLQKPVSVRLLTDKVREILDENQSQPGVLALCDRYAGC